jgi:hypothetical protein
MSNIREISPDEKKQLAAVFASMVEKAETDSKFMELCLSNTPAAFKEATGTELPETVNVKFVKQGEECNAGADYLPIPLVVDRKKVAGGNRYVSIEDLFNGKSVIVPMYMAPVDWADITGKLEFSPVEIPLSQYPGSETSFETKVKVTLSKHIVVKYAPAPPLGPHFRMVAEIKDYSPEVTFQGNHAELDMDVKVTLINHRPVLKYAAPSNWSVPKVK